MSFQIVSILQGEKMSTVGNAESNLVAETTNALGVVNGRQIFANAKQLKELSQHIRSYRSQSYDLRDAIRKIELDLFSTHIGFLVGNQCIDFQKQDGITEMEEAITANTIERRLNDLLLEEELAGRLVINRRPIYVSCVSNFTNFLDLSRKALRSLECGIPCIILSRSNTSQHSFRWTELLIRLLKEHGVDPGMVTFLSCTLNDIKDITQSNAEFTGNLYATCSRDLAASIMEGYPNTITSTGGPNTLVTTSWSPRIQEAIRVSATIESSGQCTALRHCVVPATVSNENIGSVFDSVKNLEHASEAMRACQFDGVFADHAGSPIPSNESGYRKHQNADVHLKVSGHVPASPIPEYWRKVAVDCTQMDTTNSVAIDTLVEWLNESQPISLAVNGPRKEVMQFGLSLFDRTGMVVYTLGSADDERMPPALTCQARPQEGEIFGELPPRQVLRQYTKYPVLIPSSNPSYDATYTTEYLELRGAHPILLPKNIQPLFEEISNVATRGYCYLLIEYLQDVCRLNPKPGKGTARTSVWGLQRPPRRTKMMLRIEHDTTWDQIAPVFLLFYCTNARDDIELSVDPRNESLSAFLSGRSISFGKESTDEMNHRLANRKDLFRAVSSNVEFSMVGQFVSLYMPCGHLKSTMAADKEFELLARLSSKWLNMLF
jgi:hypothetical protein